jgi:aryl-alcohol dehydrogenase-like predicted oxidoreductase
MLCVIPWSPLSGGILSGKYSRQDLQPLEEESGTRRAMIRNKGMLTERNISIAETVQSLADASGFSPSQVALAWTLRNPAVTAPIIGARTQAQLEDNLGALDVRLTEDQWQRLEIASAVELGFPHDFLALQASRDIMFGELVISRR